HRVRRRAWVSAGSEGVQRGEEPVRVVGVHKMVRVDRDVPSARCLLREPGQLPLGRRDCGPSDDEHRCRHFPQGGDGGGWIEAFTRVEESGGVFGGLCGGVRLGLRVPAAVGQRRSGRAPAVARPARSSSGAAQASGYQGSWACAVTVSDPSSYRCDRLVDDIEALRTHLGLERIDLLGHSAAGNSAALYAAAHPQRLRSLTLVTPGDTRGRAPRHRPGPTPGTADPPVPRRSSRTSRRARERSPRAPR
ncbi:alpha/beta hydrolase fold, partial [Streptomyces sp. BpilaLS-43]